MPGVIKKDQHIQIDLRTEGYGRERLELVPTPANLRYAEDLRKKIMREIANGTFVLATYFPDSPRAVKEASGLVTLGDLFTEWLAVKSPDLQHSTADHYRQTLESYHFDDVRKLAARGFKFRELKLLLAKLPKNAKTFNNVTSPLRMALEYGYRIKVIGEPLHDDIDSRKHQSPGPDPFSLEEVDYLLAKFKDSAARDYFEFAFFSGLRPSEQIALQWAKVDLRSGRVMVDQALTRGQVKGTKTGNTREVELNARAMAALDRQRARTQVAGKHVFLRQDGEAFETTDQPLRDWWKPAMKLSGMRQRDARQTRHTFATMCLMAGLTPAYVARQMGHAVEMFYRVYSRWIDGADKGAELRKLDAFLVGGEPQNGTRTGTRNPK